MKNLEDRQLKSFIKKGLLKEAPSGMLDRIMAQIVLSPARRKLTIKAMEPKGYMAKILAILMGLLVIMAAYLQPKSKFSFSIDQYLNFYINPIWVAPVVVITMSLWAYILISKMQMSKK